MTFKEFFALTISASECKTVEDFTERYGLPSFGSDKALEVNTLAFAASRSDFKTLEGFFKSRAAAARYLGIPADNLDHWTHPERADGRKPPKYLATLAAFAIVSEVLNADDGCKTDKIIIS